MTIKYCVVAECGINHSGDMDTAKEMVKAAAVAGADAVKFQFYDWADLVHEIQHTDTVEKVKQAQLSLKQLSKLRNIAHREGLQFGCTPFLTRRKLGHLAQIKPDFVKIRFRDGPSNSADKIGLLGPALEMRNIKLVYSSVLSRPVDLMSITWHPRIRWLYCLPMYPPQPEDFHPAQSTSCHGFSDHYPYITASLMAAALTRESEYIIEKHVMLEEHQDVVDREVSITFDWLEQLVQHLRIYERLRDETRRGNKMWFPRVPQPPRMVKRETLVRPKQH
jgi:N,N'-diacetyllegionaminate synthase